MEAVATLEREIIHRTTTKAIQTECHAKDADDALLERALKASRRFLHRRGYEVLEYDWQGSYDMAGITCKQDDCLVFVEVKVGNLGLPSEDTDAGRRESFEQLALDYLANRNEVDVRVRFDTICIAVLPKDKAFLRHHINVFG